MGDMGDIFNAQREFQKIRKAERRAAFDPTGWKQLSDSHFRRVVGKQRFDYWPSTGCLEFGGKYYRGIDPSTVEGFIRNRVTP